MGVSIFLNATNSTIYHKAFPVILGNYNGICVSYIKYLNYVASRMWSVTGILLL